MAQAIAKTVLLAARVHGAAIGPLPADAEPAIAIEEGEIRALKEVLLGKRSEAVLGPRGFLAAYTAAYTDAGVHYASEYERLFAQDDWDAGALEKLTTEKATYDSVPPSALEGIFETAVPAAEKFAKAQAMVCLFVATCGEVLFTCV